MELGLIFHGVLNTIQGWTNRSPAPAPASQDIVLRDSSTPDASLIVPQARILTPCAQLMVLGTHIQHVWGI